MQGVCFNSAGAGTNGLDRRRGRSTVQSSYLLRRATCPVESRQVGLHHLVFTERGERFSKNARSAFMFWRGDSVMHPFAFASGGDHTCTPQISEMPRYLGLALAKDFYEVAHAHLLAVYQVQQPETGPVGKRGKQQSQVVGSRGDIHNIIICVLTYVSRRKYIRVGICKEM